MVLTACLAVSAAILVPNFLNARQKGQLTACKSNLSTIAKACASWADDHDERFPAKLDLLVTTRMKGVPGTYLPRIPECPCWTAWREEAARSYRYRVIPPADPGAFEDLEIVCPDGRAHGLPENEPAYRMSKGLIAGKHETHAHRLDLTSNVGTGLALFFSLFSYGTALAMRPDPIPGVRGLLERSSGLSMLSAACWALLVTAPIAFSLWLTRGYHFFGLRLVLSVWLSGCLAAGLVRLGYWFWDKLTPLAPAEAAPIKMGRKPGLGAGGHLVALVPTPRERRWERAIRLGLPGFLALGMVLIPALETEPAFRGALLGVAAVAVLSYPIYQWGKMWARIATRREMEWVPGTDQLLEHRLDGARVRVLGTVAAIESVKPADPGYEVCLAGERFWLPDSELARNLALSVPHES